MKYKQSLRQFFTEATETAPSIGVSISMTSRGKQRIDKLMKRASIKNRVILFAKIFWVVNFLLRHIESGGEIFLKSPRKKLEAFDLKGALKEE